jgi:DNA-binding SARP family transcriptional activator
MRFGILGPLELWDDGTEIQLGAGRQRALLALLLLHTDEVVPTDRLIDAQATATSRACVETRVGTPTAP